MTRFEFDPDKDSLNLDRHGVRLSDAHKLWASPHVIVPAKELLGESRFAILGKVDKVVYVAVFTWRGEAIRLISFHRADKRRIEQYERYF